MAAISNERSQYVDANGKPLLGGKIFIGKVGLDPVLNAEDIFSNPQLTTPLANPQIINSLGMATFQIFVKGRYSLKVEDVNAVQQQQSLTVGTEPGSAGPIILSNVSGTNAITATASPTITEYVNGQEYRFQALTDNTAQMSLDIDGIGAKDIADGVTKAGQWLSLYFNSVADNFQITNRIDDFIFTAFENSGTWTRNVATKSALIFCVGGGGGGGGASNTSIFPAGGGGAGALSITFATSFTGATDSVTIGEGGAGGMTNIVGGNGTESSVGTLCVAKGAIGGSSLFTGGTGGQSGSGTGTLKVDGGQGHTVDSVTGRSVAGGHGGASFMGGGGRGGSGGNAPGSAGTVFGSGGGGGAVTGGVGGDAKGGVVLILEFS